MSQPNAKIIEDIKPKTVGDIVDRNIEEVKSILKDDSPDLDKSSVLLAENKALLSHGGFSTEITPEILEDVAKKVEEAPKINAQDQQIEIGKHEFLLLIQNATGLDFSDGEASFSMFDIFDAIVSMAEPGAMDTVIDKMMQAAKDMKATNPDATTKEQKDAVIEAGNKTVDEMGQGKELGLTGVNGTAVTYAVTKEPDSVVEGIAIKPAIQDGTPLITDTFTAHVGAVGTMIDAKVDQDAVNQPDFALPEQEATVAQNVAPS